MADQNKLWLAAKTGAALGRSVGSLRRGAGDTKSYWEVNAPLLDSDGPEPVKAMPIRVVLVDRSGGEVFVRQGGVQFPHGAPAGIGGCV